MSKNIKSFSGLVYSTDPNFTIDNNEVVEQATLLPEVQK